MPRMTQVESATSNGDENPEMEMEIDNPSEARVAKQPD